HKKFIEKFQKDILENKKINLLVGTLIPLIIFFFSFLYLKNLLLNHPNQFIVEIAFTLTLYFLLLLIMKYCTYLFALGDQSNLELTQSNAQKKITFFLDIALALVILHLILTHTTSIGF